MTAVGFTTAQESDCRVNRVVAKKKLKPLFVASADSRDRVERIRQTPSDESVSRNFAEVVGLMIGVVNGVRGVNPRSSGLALALSFWANSKCRAAPDKIQVAG